MVLRQSRTWIAPGDCQHMTKCIDSSEAILNSAFMTVTKVGSEPYLPSSGLSPGGRGCGDGPTGHNPIFLNAAHGVSDLVVPLQSCVAPGQCDTCLKWRY